VDFKDLRERRIAQFLVSYAAVGWVVLQLVDQVVDRSVLPEVVYRVALTLFLCGLPGALIVTWFHGAKGVQRAPPVEKWLLGAVAILAVGASVIVARANTRVDEVESASIVLSDTEDPRRVAVLYFDTQGGGEDAAFLAAGLTESLIDELGTVDSLSVVSRNGSELFRQAPRPPADSIGRALGVGLLVDGTVALAGERVRVTVDMVDAADGTQLRSTRFERPRAQLFDLQDSLSLQVADFLRAEIGLELGQIVLRRGTDSREAWERVQQASLVEDRADEALDLREVDQASATLVAADSILAIAEAADPGWVEPVSRRGWLAYRQSRLGGFDRATWDQWIEIGLGHADRALAIDPDDPSSLDLKGTLLYWRYLLGLIPDPEDADEAYRTAEDLLRAAGTPSAQASLAHLLVNRGEIQLGYAAARNSYEADPFLSNANLTLWRLTSSQWDLGDDRQSRRWCDEGRRRFPDYYRFQQCRLMLQSLPGVTPDIPEAWDALARFVELSPPQNAELNEKLGLQLVGAALARAELADSARAVMVRGRASAELDPARGVALRESIGRVILSDWDEATRLMGLYFSANPTAVIGYRTSLAQNMMPWYHAGLEDQPAFRSLLGLN
jgi:TolB-like protein